MKNKPEQLYNLLQSIDGIVWEADAAMRQFTFISKQVRVILGYTEADLLGQPDIWEKLVHPADLHIIDTYRELVSGNLENHTFKYRLLRADGNIVWIRDNVSVVYEGDKPVRLCGVMIDNTIAGRLTAIERLERDMLSLNSDLTVPMQQVLLSYLQGLENLFPGLHCSIHRISNGHFTDSISSSLPQAFLDTLNGKKIGPREGSCGTAAATKQQVIVSDIFTDPLWDKYRDMATEFDLAACWSNPVINSNGEVLATLAMYYREPKSPGKAELKVMERGTALLRVILENREKTEIISEANLLMLQSQELAHFGNWRWDVRRDIVSWSPALYTIYGLDAAEFKATFAGYQEMLHAEDRLRVYQIIETVLKTGKDAEFEERIIRPNGEIRHLRSWAKLKSDALGQPLEMIGACLDITEKVSQLETIEKRDQQLLEIAWLQSHVIRSPLVKIMGLVDLIKDSPTDDQEKNELLDYLLTAANELDEQIRGICGKTEAVG